MNQPTEKKGYDKIAMDDLKKQANEIADNLKSEKIKADPNKEIIAVIAYLQRLGTDIKHSTVQK